jgi:serine/threonine-protein kinase
VSTDGAHAGISYDEPSRRDAEAVAVRQCQESGKGKRLDCRSQLWFREACGALAMGEDGGFGTGCGAGPQRACAYAFESCRDQRVRACEAMFYACTPQGPRGACGVGLRSDQFE